MNAINSIRNQIFTNFRPQTIVTSIIVLVALAVLSYYKFFRKATTPLNNNNNNFKPLPAEGKADSLAKRTLNPKKPDPVKEPDGKELAEISSLKRKKVITIESLVNATPDKNPEGYSPFTEAQYPPILPRLRDKAKKDPKAVDISDAYYQKSFVMTPKKGPNPLNRSYAAENVAQKNVTERPIAYKDIRDIDHLIEVYKKWDSENNVSQKGWRERLPCRYWKIYDTEFQELAKRLIVPDSAPEKGKITFSQAKHMRGGSAEGLIQILLFRAYCRALAQERYPEDYTTLRSYDLRGIDPANLEIPQGVDPNHKCNIEVANQNTSDAGVALFKKVNPDPKANPIKKVGVVNFANGHNLGGGPEFQRKGGSQEEHLAGESTILDGLAHFAENDVECRAKYRANCHLPLGGVVYMENHTLNPDQADDIPLSSLSLGFADFRSGEYYAELSEFADFENAKSDQYKKRVRLDPFNVLLCAKMHGVRNLILGASGCGAFGHVNEEEALAWQEVLNSPVFKGCFDNVVFAIWDRNAEDPASNFAVFQKRFA